MVSSLGAGTHFETCVLAVFLLTAWALAGQPPAASAAADNHSSSGFAAAASVNKSGHVLEEGPVEMLEPKRRQRRWGNYNGWHGGNPHPPPNFVPYIPNNNVAIGYPTAYGLSMGYIRQGGNNPYGGGGGAGEAGPPGTNNPRFPVRCTNGGAHIGQCRLDEDAICMALGGTCINSACCTTPFLGLMTLTTTRAPNIVDGEADPPPRPRSASSEEEDDGGREGRGSDRKASAELEEEKQQELAELSKVLEYGRRAGLSTDSPIFAVFSGLFETTTAASAFSTVTGLAEWDKLSTTEPPSTTATTTESPAPSTFPSTPPATSVPKTTAKRSTIPWKTTRRPPAQASTPTPKGEGLGSIESSSSEEAEVGPNDYSKKYCDNGLRPIGPCNEDASCPVDHSCQRGDICCYDYAMVMMNSVRKQQQQLG